MNLNYCEEELLFDYYHYWQ